MPTSNGGIVVPMFMAVIGSITALFAATIAVAQNDIKRVLAYSTISQLGFMIAALGIGGFVAAAFHLVTHAFFKALLFLGSGSVIHGMEHGVLHVGDHIDPQDMTNMGGLRKKMPVTFWTFLIGGFALSGFPFITAGFWSKDEILADAWAHAPAVFVVLALAALLTAFYTMRQITLTFLGKPRTHAAEHAQETPWTMTLPLAILSVFAIGFGWLGIPENFLGLHMPFPNWFHEFVGGTLVEHPEALPFSPVPLLTSLVVALGGLWLGWQLYKGFSGVDPVQKALPAGIYNGMRNRWYFDELYQAVFIKPANWLSEVFASQIMDRQIIDGILHGLAYIVSPLGHFFREWIDKRIVNKFGDEVAEQTKEMGGTFRTIQTGRVQQYMIVALIAIAAFAATFYVVQNLQLILGLVR
ncbi:MAG: proton-conducting transporter membrane subunit [Chloroflexota bacterium]